MSISTKSRRDIPAAARPWLLLSLLAAGLALAGSAWTLANQELYADLTDAFLPQALAQDLVNLFVVSPAIIVLALLALRGSTRAAILWLGALLFTVYNYVIYVVAIPFGPMFLPWVAVLGLALFPLLGGAACIDRSELLAGYADRRATRASAVALLIVAVLFGLLWLSEDIPALLDGTTPQTLIDLATITNPVHVLDLAFFLPASMLVGALWLRGEPRAGTIAPAFLVFMVLTGLPILATPVVQAVRGEAAGWAVVIPIGIVTLVVLALLGWLLATMRPYSAWTARTIEIRLAMTDG
jgi:hypothetical protein